MVLHFFLACSSVLKLFKADSIILRFTNASAGLSCRLREVVQVVLSATFV